MIQIGLADEASSESLAYRLAGCLFSPLILAFSGEIGSGKTTLIRAMLRALGVTTAIKSPTFSLIESYQCNHLQIHHFDLYRIHDEAELEYIGFRDYFNEDAVCCIEWPEKAGQSLEQVDIHFELTLNGDGRLLTVQASSPAGEEILSCLAGNQ
ncbi:tRNA (adenosine(37)-N6)-threonylcarbamoyltransferase complex ATPase subunit type 1 TsaE [Tatlockia sp. PL877]|nr:MULTISPECIES: tRNA (adenosine(37)-N6)-threonylcarbamoyltransferase complex ATPase subunit type 1 TsaE [unclassified Legionella]MDI9818424.1 tRNA (adenosine(37)-N6)-threonylcarbamoyltransferase complex ATPase subunit type 1 TsaE [Legionella sp. PL877]